MSKSKFTILEIPSNFIRIRFSSEGQSIFVISNIVFFIRFLGFSALLTTLAIWPERECGERHFQDTMKLMRVMNFAYHESPFWLYCVLATAFYSILSNFCFSSL